MVFSVGGLDSLSVLPFSLLPAAYKRRALYASKANAVGRCLTINPYACSSIVVLALNGANAAAAS